MRWNASQCRNVVLLMGCASVLAAVVWGREPARRDASVRPAAHARRLETPVALPATMPAAPMAPYKPGLEHCEAYPVPPELQGIDLSKQTHDEVMAKSWGCIQCHQNTGDPHGKSTVRLGCCDCHGGDAMASSKELAHVAPMMPQAWLTSANPVRSYTLLNHERPEFVRFVNPGDLRIAHLSCGTANCHPQETLASRKSMMTHGAMLWGAALYNNGSVPHKISRYGESYSMYGAPQRLQTFPPPTPEEIALKGVVPFLDPLPRYEITQPGNVLRIFERGGRFRPEVGLPERLEEPGRPRERLSIRGLGTENRTDPVFVGLQKTRLLDPTLNFLGTNDHPGDYRSSGCTACHMVYANDRSPVHSGPYHTAGHLGMTQNPDPMIPKDERGHPIEHKFTTGVPTSQCITCHVHPGTNVMNSYLGFTWWDNEVDGELMYPAAQRRPSSEEQVQAMMNNPDEASLRGNWSDPAFLERTSELNPYLKHTQFADFHSHGWVYRAVFKKDRHGHLLDHKEEVIVEPDTPKLQAAMCPPSDLEQQCGKERDGVPVHLMDIHLEKGMHCVDCHFHQDVHGNTKLYGEVRAAIEISCIDCHGTVKDRANLITTGPAAPPGGTNLRKFRTPFGKPRFEDRGSVIVQNSMVEEGLSWEVTQVRDTVNPVSKDFNENALLAKTVRFDAQGNMVYGELPSGTGEKCAHDNATMNCIACHSSWNPSCYGCHLPQKANLKMPSLHNEGDVARNYVSYNFQTLRDEVYMLAKDGDVTGNKIGPARSSCAIHVGSYNGNRESIYVQQQTISADGLSGIAFSTNVPHTVRGAGETKMCNDCHIDRANDNNALLSQLLMQGTNFLNFVGRYCYVGAGEEGFEAVVVTEREEPQAVIGSTLHRMAYPDNYREHVERESELEHAHEHPGKDIGDSLLHPLMKPEILSLQLRGEFLYAACGEGGLRVFDVAFIDNKAFSERITTAPVSPLGQRLYVRTKFATAVAAPTTIAPDPTRVQNPENGESPIAPYYGNIFVTDKYEGLVIVGVGTLLDGNPTNNFLRRESTFNPEGILNGARNITIAGQFAYICCDVGIAVVSIADAAHPDVVAVLDGRFVDCPTAVAIQFRYAFVTDRTGLRVFDVTELSRPRPVATLPLPEARNIYIARTYAYISGGEHGLIIVDVERPASPRVDQIYNADGEINDLNDVKLGITNNSEFAYLADGHNGLRVVQLTSPDTPGMYGFSPRPTPMLIATRKMPKEGRALCVSKGVDRDRAVDESGQQIAVFGRMGARPLNLEEQRRLYLRNGKLWTVVNDPRDSQYRYLGGEGEKVRR
jgi:hypothetical protein